MRAEKFPKASFFPIPCKMFYNVGKGSDAVCHTPSRRTRCPLARDGTRQHVSCEKPLTPIGQRTALTCGSLALIKKLGHADWEQIPAATPIAALARLWQPVTLARQGCSRVERSMPLGRKTTESPAIFVSTSGSSLLDGVLEAAITSRHELRPLGRISIGAGGGIRRRALADARFPLHRRRTGRSAHRTPGSTATGKKTYSATIRRAGCHASRLHESPRLRQIPRSLTWYQESRTGLYWKETSQGFVPRDVRRESG